MFEINDKKKKKKKGGIVSTVWLVKIQFLDIWTLSQGHTGLKFKIWSHDFFEFGGVASSFFLSVLKLSDFKNLLNLEIFSHFQISRVGILTVR